MDFNKINIAINKLQHKISSNDSIDEITKEFDFCIATNNINNNKTVLQAFYNSKLFLSIIDCLSDVSETNALKLLTLVEKIMKNNKQIAKYLAKNVDFINLGLIEICIKICEELFINRADLIQIDALTNFNDNYTHTKLTQLDLFCRLLAILIFDHKKIEFKQKFKHKEYLKIKPNVKITNVNQALCLNLNDFPKLIYTILKKRIKQIIAFQKDSYNYENTTLSLLSELQNSLNRNNSSSINTANSNNTSNTNTINTTNNNIIDNSIDDIDSKKIFNEIELDYVNDEALERNYYHQTKTFFYKLTKQNIHTIVETDVFGAYNVNWERISMFRNKNNIYNQYTEMSRIIKKFGPKIKTNERVSQYITYLKFTTFQIEMFFVISTLLGGKRKVEVQEFSSKQNLIPLLSEYIDYLDWGNIHEESTRPIFNTDGINLQDENSYHGNGCKCDVDSALKIQFLRLIYNYCCKDQSNIGQKLDLLSAVDIEDFFSPKYILIFSNYFVGQLKKFELKKYETKKDIIYSKEFYMIEKNLHDNKLKNIDTEKILENLIIDGASINYFTKLVKGLSTNKDVIGLLKKIIFKFIVECPYSSAKFWLSSCIEVILRGNNTFIQYYVAQCGLMPCLLNDIIYSKTEKSALLQMSFDVLAELVKFNKANFILLNYYLFDSNEYKVLCSKIISKNHLVDSNVFLRSVILSKEKFKKYDEDNKIEEKDKFINNCKICGFIEKHICEIFFNLVELVNPDDINQTNISCINTSLIILIIKFQMGQLETFLEELSQSYDNASKNLINLRNLLLTWKQFYNYRSKDCASLEHSTSIPFNVWYNVTEVLLDEDKTKKSSLLYYEI